MLDEYPYSFDETSCSSPSISSSSITFNGSQIILTDLSFSQTGEITLTCSYWRNPISPKLVEYTLETTDGDDFVVNTAIFTHDATNYQSSVIQDSSIEFDLEVSFPEEHSRYDLKIKPDTPIN